VTLTEVQPAPAGGEILDADALPDLVGLDRSDTVLIGYDVFASIYNRGKLSLLASWSDRPAAEDFAPHPLPDASIRHRIIRIVREYGMFDRRESPQYYPDIKQRI
jgi:hypothetical protein